MAAQEPGGGGGGATTTVINTTTRKFDTGSVTKLNGTNYRVWKIRMESLFASQSSLGIVKGTTSRPAAGPDREKHDQKAQDAMTAMLLTMSDQEVENISGCGTAAEVWKKLGTMYESTSGENKQLLWKQFYEIMTTDSPVKTLCEIQSYAAQLRSLGVTVDDDAIVARMTSSMQDSKFRQFREA